MDVVVLPCTMRLVHDDEAILSTVHRLWRLALEPRAGDGVTDFLFDGRDIEYDHCIVLYRLR